MHDKSSLDWDTDFFGNEKDLHNFVFGILHENQNN